MGPVALFDKSFLQSLTVDESVWFGHFFMPVLAPLFYLETLGDLEKTVRAGRTAEKEVRIIAEKVPDMNVVPNVFHGTLALEDLFGHRVSMNGRPVVAGGRPVMRDGKLGIVFDESPEAEAFSRWQRCEFLEIERGAARGWRASLAAVDLGALANEVRKLGVNSSTCRTLEDARTLARGLVTMRDKPIDRVAMVAHALGLSPEYHRPLAERFMSTGAPALVDFAPYAAHVIEVETFFQFALAAGLIGTERSSNKVDIAYLNYLPFCQLFISSDKLHRRCAPILMRKDQVFVWGFDLKSDLARMNDHFMALPESERERGVMAIAKAPPKIEGSLVRELRAKFFGAGYDDRERKPRDPDAPSDAKLIQELKDWTKSPAPPSDWKAPAGSEPQMLSIKRRVRKKRGSWWQVDKDMPAAPDDDD